MARKIILNDFPKDNRIWQLVWFGETERNITTGRIDQIWAFLVPGREGIETANLSEFRNHWSFNKGIWIKISLRFFPIIDMGTLWRNGVQITNVSPFNSVRFRPDQKEQEHRKLENVTIKSSYLFNNKSRGRTKRIEDFWTEYKSEDHENWSIPLFELPIQTDSKPGILFIPAILVLKALFGGSFALVDEIINGGLPSSKFKDPETNKIWNPKNTFESNQNSLKTGFLCLRKKMKDAQASEIALLCWDSKVRATISGIQPRLAYAHYNILPQHIFPNDFPLYPRSLTCVTKDLNTEDSDVYLGLCLKITAIDFDYPLDDLVFDRDNRNDPKTNRTSDVRSNWSPSKINKSTQEPMEEAEASSNDDTRTNALEEDIELSSESILNNGKGISFRKGFLRTTSHPEDMRSSPNPRWEDNVLSFSGNLTRTEPDSSFFPINDIYHNPSETHDYSMLQNGFLEWVEIITHLKSYFSPSRRMASIRILQISLKDLGARRDPWCFHEGSRRRIMVITGKANMQHLSSFFHLIDIERFNNESFYSVLLIPGISKGVCGKAFEELIKYDIPESKGVIKNCLIPGCHKRLKRYSEGLKTKHESALQRRGRIIANHLLRSFN